MECKIDLKAKLLPWQQHSKGHFFVIPWVNITVHGAKFEQHHSNISRDILDFVMYIFVLKRFMTSSIFEQKLEYLWNDLRYLQKENAILAHVPFERSFK